MTAGLHCQCPATQRACPPEDCGGAWGYQDLLDVLSDPSHENHKQLCVWLGENFDPEEFDKKSVVFDDPEERWKHAFGQGGESEHF